MAHEMRVDFTWAYQVFYEIVRESHPPLLVTYQDLALKNTTKFVFTDADKHLCMWNIWRCVIMKAQKVVLSDEIM